jgi:CHAT domain-containing protein
MKLSDAFSAGDLITTYQLANAMRADRGANATDRLRATALTGIAAIRFGDYNHGRQLVDAALSSPNRAILTDLLTHLQLARGYVAYNDIAAARVQGAGDDKPKDLSPYVARAHVELEKAISLFEKQGLTSRPEYYDALATDALVDAHIDRAKAVDALSRLANQSDKRLKTDDPAQAFILIRLADAKLDKDRSAATAELKRALAIAEKSFPRHPIVADIHGLLAEALVPQQEGARPREFTPAFDQKLLEVGFYKSTNDPHLISYAYEWLSTFLDEHLDPNGDSRADEFVPDWIATAEKAYGPNSVDFLNVLRWAHENIRYDSSYYSLREQLLRRIIQVSERMAGQTEKTAQAVEDLINLLDLREGELRDDGKTVEAKALETERLNLQAKFDRMHQNAAGAIPAAVSLKAKAKTLKDQNDYVGSAGLYEQAYALEERKGADRKELFETARELSFLYGIFISGSPDAATKGLKYIGAALSAATNSADPAVRRERDELAFLQAVVLARSGKSQAADRTLVDALAAGLANRNSEFEVEHRKPYGLSLIETLARDDTAPASAARSLAIILQRLPDNATIDERAVARALRELQTIPAEHRSDAGAVAKLLVAATGGDPSSYFRGLEGALRAVPADQKGKLLDELQEEAKASKNVSGLASLYVQHLIILSAADPKRDSRVDTSDWLELAQAYLSAGDVVRARMLLRGAPPDQRSAIAVSIAVETREHSDVEAALQLSLQEASLDRRVSRIETLVAGIRKSKSGVSWREIAAKLGPERQWRFVGELLADGNTNDALAALDSAPGDQLGNSIAWAVGVLAESGRPIKDFPGVDQLLARVDRIPTVGERARTLNAVASSVHDLDPSLMLDLARRAVGPALEAAKSDCAKGKTCTFWTLEWLSSKLVEGGSTDEALKLAAAAPPAARFDIFLSIASELAKISRDQSRQIFKQAEQAAGSLSDRSSFALNLTSLARAQARSGFVDDAVANVKRAELIDPAAATGRSEAEARNLIEVLTLGGEPERAEALLPSIQLADSKVLAQAQIAAGWARRRDNGGLKRALERVAKTITIAPADAYWARQTIRDEIADKAAESGNLDAIEIVASVGGSYSDLGYIIRDFPAQIDGDEIGKRALAALDRLPKPADAKYNHELAYLATGLAKRGAKDAARAILNKTSLSILPRPAGRTSEQIAEEGAAKIRSMIAALNELAPQLPPALAGKLAGELEIASDQLDVYGSGLPAAGLAAARRLADRGMAEKIPVEAEVALELIRQKTAKLQGTPVDFKQEAFAELAAISSRPEEDRLLAYEHLAAKAAANGAFEPALEAARRATRLHRDQIFQRLTSWDRSFAWLEAQVREDRSYFLQIALLKKAIDAGGDASTLLPEAFRTAQWLGFNSLSAEQAVDQALPAGQGLRSLERKLAAEQRSQELGGAPAGAQTAALERSIRQIHRSARQHVDQSEPSLKQVQAALGNHQALLMLVQDPPRNYLQLDGKSANAMMFVIRRNRAELIEVEWDSLAVTQAETLLKDAAAIAQAARSPIAVDGVSGGPAVPHRQFDVGTAHQLYLNLLAPAEKALIGVDELLVVPGSVLNRVPLQMLVTDAPSPEAEGDPSKIAWLIRRYKLTVIPSPGDLIGTAGQSRKTPASRPFIGFGDPALGRSAFAQAPKTSVIEANDRPNTSQLATLPALPDTAEELRLTAEALASGQQVEGPECTICTAEHATEHHLRMLSDSGALQDFKIISFATHGLVAGDIDGLAESALVLTPGSSNSSEDDGLLTATEAGSLKLSADLVMLSACNTAVVKAGTDQSALSDLASAFLYAGAKAVLVSYWPVNSRATAHLIAGAAQYVRQHPRAAFNDALRQTMLDMIDGKLGRQWTDPYYWAPFTLVQARPSGDRQPSLDPQP